MKNSVLGAALVAAVLMGCGSAGSNDGPDGGVQTSTPDSGTQIPSDAGHNNNKPDAGQQDKPDAGNTDPEPTCLIDTANFGELNALNDGLAEGAEGYAYFEAVLTDDVDVIAMELVAGLGVFADGLVPGTYTLSGDELSYETCGACILLFANAEDDNAQIYMATGGTLKLDSVQGQLTGSVSNLTFQHVTIDGKTLVTTPVNDGCVSAITSASFDAVIQPIQ